ncbi:Gfo/Idh/MocA family protein [Natronoglomus mannanivorans]|uniref:Gfo/Idh/MocA family oxidoreductase n=1 Tax=Natronoglomus mannanivorans TaxID=2979990 RepID=A0AAP3E3R8_9EURY|nr:Gfo/Idh/MocA family oxidoreductase [Halobacteria archaeon AArc-xg1-1]
MIDVGILGLDTSHPETFAAILDDREGVTVGAVWDGGDVRDESYTTAFCEEYDAIRYDEPRELIGEVDAIMILTVDWSVHRSLAVPFLEGGIPTMIDKPLAGSVADVDAIEAAAERGDAPLFGGSAVPFHPDAATVTELTPQTVFGSGYGDPFYYGAHLIDTVRLAVDADWTRVEPVDAAEQIIAISFENGATATVHFDGPETEGSFSFLCVSDDETGVTKIESTVTELERMYDPFLDGFLETARGERDERDRLVDGAQLLLAVQQAFETGEPFPPGEDASATAPTIDSAAFVATYEPYY